MNCLLLNFDKKRRKKWKEKVEGCLAAPAGWEGEDWQKCLKILSTFLNEIFLFFEITTKKRKQWKEKVEGGLAALAGWEGEDWQKAKGAASHHQLLSILSR